MDFVQIGANVGFTDNDPLYNKIIKDGWKGILVEPNPKAFKQLVKTYWHVDGLEFVSAAITSQPGYITLYVDNYHIDNNGRGEGTSQHASCDMKVMRKHGYKDHDLTPVRCPAMTLNNLFDEYDLYDKHLKLLCLDTEGYDANILLNTDFSRMKIDTIQFEYIHCADKLDLVLNHLSNYKLKAKIGEDCILEYETKTN